MAEKEEKTLKGSRRATAGNKMFLSAPREEDLRPTEREKYLLGELWDWQQRSAKTPWVLGKPMRSQA
jgi:hypothetical protein